MRLATAFLLLATGVAWLAWELVLVHERLVPISVVMKDAALRSCALPFGWCLLAGHWWVNWDIVDRRAPFSAWPVWVALLAALVLADVAVGVWAGDRTWWPTWARVLRYPGLWALVGLVAGPLTWPQRAVL